MLEHVARVREAVVLADATADPRFSGNPYIASGHTRSLLCLPLLHQGRMSGVLYLENELAQGAFSEDRIELLQLLSSHAAVAVENALLYTHVQEVGADLRTANERLEREVAGRTEELRAANERLHHELAEREQAEEARRELQEEVIRMQQAMERIRGSPARPSRRA